VTDFDRSSVAIAEVVRDLRAGRVGVSHEDPEISARALAGISDTAPVVDATQIYRSLADNPKPVYIYEDHPSIAPPWQSAFVCYVNEHGNVIVMHLFSEELSKAERSEKWVSESNEVDWAKVRWVTQVTIWLGGRSATLGKRIPVTGPAHVWLHAVYESGEPADIRWVHLNPKYPMKHWDMANLVILGALNYMNCRNVDIVEPLRPRAQARQIKRTGVQVSIINVFPIGKSTRSKGKGGGQGVPLTSVRGHFACYGPDYGKGLLFGKLQGRFWIPQYARGDRDLGESRHDYALRPDGKG
jgi:hypothetical protein